MPNRTLKGVVKDETGAALAGLIVGAYDPDSLMGLIPVRDISNSGPPLYGHVRSQNDGSYEITGFFANPSMYVRVFDPVRRLLHVTQRTQLTQPTVTLPDIQIPKRLAGGHLVTLGGSTPTHHSSGNTVDFLIDNERAFARVIQVVKNAIATTALEVMQLAFAVPDDPMGAPRLFMIFDPGMPADNQPTTGTTLEKELLDAAKLRNVPVRLLVHDGKYAISADAVLAYFAALNTQLPGYRDVEVRSFPTDDWQPLHAKPVLIDGVEAVIVGSPFTSDYFDDYRHRIDDARRGAVELNLFGHLGYAIGVPIHEVSIWLKGPAVADLADVFVLHWDQPSIRGAKPAIGPPAASTAQPQDVGIQIVRTLRGNGFFPSKPEGETGILEAYQRAIRYATDYVYLENQYFTSDPIVDALVLALKDNSNLQVILVFNMQTDIPPYNVSQPQTLQQFLGALDAGERARVGIFTLWSHETGSPKPRISREYVHSKMGIIDDKWATVGTANLDDVSLRFSTQALYGTAMLGASIGTRLQERASEVNAVILDGLEQHPTSGVVAQLRRALWSEHLGFHNAQGVPSPTHTSLAAPPAGGWLKLWNDRTQDKLNGLKTDPTVVSPTRALPFPRDADGMPQFGKFFLGYGILGPDTPYGYLKILGVDPERLKIVMKSRSYSFESGTWE